MALFISFQRKILLKKSIKKKTSKIIFLNQNLKKYTNINKRFNKRLFVQGAGFDGDYFYDLYINPMFQGDYLTTALDTAQIAIEINNLIAEKHQMKFNATMNKLLR